MGKLLLSVGMQLSLGLMTGCASVPRSGLLVPQDSPSLGTYAASCSMETLNIPVKVKVLNADMKCTVTTVDWMGTTVQAGVFDAGKIIAREFDKVASANFAQPAGGDAPAAALQVEIKGVGVRWKQSSNFVETVVRMEVVLVKEDDARTVGYHREFVKRASSPWNDASKVPDSFNMVIKDAVDAFLEDWSSSDASRMLQGWWYGRPGGLAPAQVRLPELQSLRWTSGSQDGVYIGTCVIKCNGYEAFRAKSWASEQIFAECRRHLGNVAKDRIRVIYDIDDDIVPYDEETKTWTIKFCTFARTRIVFEYGKYRGFVIGDMELMNLPGQPEQASDVLHKYVQEEVERREGRGQKVHFENYKVEKDTLRFDFRVRY